MVKLLVRDRETIQEAVRRFRKLERSGIKKKCAAANITKSQAKSSDVVDCELSVVLAAPVNFPMAANAASVEPS